MVTLEEKKKKGVENEHRKWSPVKGARQEVGGRVEPAHAVCDGAYACDGLVLLLGRTLLLRQVVWDVCVLLHQHCRALLEWQYQLSSILRLHHLLGFHYFGGVDCCAQRFSFKVRADPDNTSLDGHLEGEADDPSDL